MAAVDRMSSIFATDRSRRQQTEAPSPSEIMQVTPSHEIWDSLRTFAPAPEALDRNKMIAAARQDPAHVAFDVLRTRMTMAMKERGWHRVGISSPTPSCGKSFVVGNLAISFSRQEELKTVVMDLDLNSPSLAKYMGVTGCGSMAEYLAGNKPMEAHFMRPTKGLSQIGPNIAVGLNEQRELFGSELLQYPSTELALNEVQAQLDPDIMIFDLPPVLSSDAVVALGSQLDCILLVVSGERSKTADISEAERLIAETKPLLGVVMNKASGSLFG